jgi:RNA polymerase sigma-70 factor (ECF subfamily)
MQESDFRYRPSSSFDGHQTSKPRESLRGLRVNSGERDGSELSDSGVAETSEELDALVGLVEAARAGEALAFDALVSKFLPTLQILAYQQVNDRTTADDITFEAFERAFRSLDRLEDPRRFASWLYMITRRLCVDWFRRHGRHSKSLSLESLKEQGLEPRNPESESEESQQEKHELVRSALESLPERYRLVLTLQYFRGLKLKDISVHLNEPEGTIANRLHRAKRLLKERLAREGLGPCR